MIYERHDEAFDILLVEDNPGDVRLTQETLKDAKVRNDLRVAVDGDEAMAVLKKEGDHVGAPRPDLILLDLNLPGVSGREVLAEIKNDPDLKRIPVVVLTSSKAEQDVLMSYELQANAYITKPVDLARFVEAVRSIEQFWFSIVTLPPQQKTGAL